MFSPNKKIVVVDDSILNLKIIEKYLGNNYIELILISDPKDALSIIKQELPDLILLDIHMPEISGLDIFKEMKKDPILSLISVIFITASEEKLHLQQAYHLGSIDYIHKPILKEELITKVHNYLFHLEEKNILQRYYRIIDDFVYTLITNPEHIILYVSSALIKRMEIPKHEIIGCKFNEITLCNEKEMIWEDIYITLKQNSLWKGKIKFKTKEHFFWGDTIIESIYDNKNHLIGYQYIINDITDKLALQELAIRDPLTKVYNRLRISELIQYEIEKAQRYNKTFSLIMIDIDDFKQINDTFGHNFGDVVLKEFTNVLVNSVRKIDIVGRWGGEEFIILLPETKIDKSLNVAKRIKENLLYKSVSYNNIILPINTASFGLTEYTSGDNLISLVEKVDQTLYISKKNGKNRISM
ncbi:MAG: hypothetical protein KatS3mg129_1478 [Leptospiraceae bacterium]|nr:MAG: hypothetical protein KatS3mg129_1478 [Leptospiraceae bacterium]